MWAEEGERECVCVCLHLLIYTKTMSVTHLKTPTHPYRCDEVESHRNLQSGVSPEGKKSQNQNDCHSHLKLFVRHCLNEDTFRVLFLTQMLLFFLPVFQNLHVYFGLLREK